MHSGMRLSSHVTVTDASDGIVLLDLRHGTYWQLNETGAIALKMLLQGGDIEAACGQIAAEFDVNEQVARQDVIAIIDEFVEAEIVIRDTQA